MGRAKLGSVDVAFYPEKTPLNDLFITVFFGFTALSASLGVLLPHPGSERIRAAAVAQQWFMTGLGLAVLLMLAAFPVLLVFTPWRRGIRPGRFNHGGLGCGRPAVRGGACLLP